MSDGSMKEIHLTGIQELMLCQLACDDPCPVDAVEIIERVKMRFSEPLIVCAVSAAQLEKLGMVEVVSTMDVRYYSLSDDGRAYVEKLLAANGTSISELQAILRMVTATIVKETVREADRGKASA
jgi:hypothetical protein